MDDMRPTFEDVDKLGRESAIQRLPQALQSGLPNEVDWAFRALTVLSFDGFNIRDVRPFARRCCCHPGYSIFSARFVILPCLLRAQSRLGTHFHCHRRAACLVTTPSRPVCPAVSTACAQSPKVLELALEHVQQFLGPEMRPLLEGQPLMEPHPHLDLFHPGNPPAASEDDAKKMETEVLRVMQTVHILRNLSISPVSGMLQRGACAPPSVCLSSLAGRAAWVQHLTPFGGRPLAVESTGHGMFEDCAELFGSLVRISRVSSWPFPGETCSLRRRSSLIPHTGLGTARGLLL